MCASAAKLAIKVEIIRCDAANLHAGIVATSTEEPAKMPFGLGRT